MKKHWSDRLVPVKTVEYNCKSCGSSAMLATDPKRSDKYFVQCWNDVCGRITQICNNPEQAVAEWDKRNK